jgi:putative endonuclease
MDKFYTYILVNESGDYYKGHTSDLSNRIIEHNAGKTKSNKSKGPYRLFYYEIYPTRELAVQREKYFKSGAGRRYVKKLEELSRNGEDPLLQNGYFG